MRIHKASLGLPIILLTLLWSSSGIGGIFSSPDSETKALPTFSLPTLSSGKNFTNKTLVGQVSLLNIWASWCKYCRNEHEMLMKIKNDYHIPIYGVIFKDSSENAREWLKSSGNPYILTAVDENGTLGEKLGVYGTPQTYVIDKHGMIRYQYTGGIDSSSWEETLLPLIQKLEKEK